MTKRDAVASLIDVTIDDDVCRVVGKTESGKEIALDFSQLAVTQVIAMLSVAEAQLKSENPKDDFVAGFHYQSAEVTASTKEHSQPSLILTVKKFQPGPDAPTRLLFQIPVAELEKLGWVCIEAVRKMTPATGLRLN